MKMNEKTHGFNIDNSYLKLNSKLYTTMAFRNIYDPELIILNTKLVAELGLDKNYLTSKNGLSLLTGSVNEFLSSGFAQAYAGHQFGYFSILGDGRALMIGEHVTTDNKRFDIQLKGSGRTSYSRGGDGKATLYSMLREYIISEAMNGLKIPTTRSLAVVKTNERIRRTSIEDGAVLTRIAQSHIRVGTFAFVSSTGNKSLLKELADYTINRHYSYIKDSENKYIEFFKEVVLNQAKLISNWQSVGFIHGVMNTDNMALSGETIDYGPCAFMDVYKPNTVFSSIDRDGRYAYSNQPFIGSWNLSKLAESLLPLFSNEMKEAVELANIELKKYEELFIALYYKKMLLKLGITNLKDDDKSLVDELLLIMEKYKLDYTNTFRELSSLSISLKNEDLKNWYLKWENRVKEESTLEESIKIMKNHNPVIIPRNNMVEEALEKASKHNNMELFNELLNALSNPYDYTKTHKEDFLNPIINSQYMTYCGT